MYDREYCVDTIYTTNLRQMLNLLRNTVAVRLPSNVVKYVQQTAARTSTNLHVPAHGTFDSSTRPRFSSLADSGNDGRGNSMTNSSNESSSTLSQVHEQQQQSHKVEDEGERKTTWLQWAAHAPQPIASTSPVAKDQEETLGMTWLQHVTRLPI
jgi:hypothetical protein